MSTYKDHKEQNKKSWAPQEPPVKLYLSEDLLDSIKSICMALDVPIFMPDSNTYTYGGNTLDLVEGQDFEVIKPKLLTDGNKEVI